MEIHETTGADGTVEYDVTLHERKLEDLKRLQKYDRVDEKPFEAVAALSELTERAYELLVRPAVREATPEWLAKAAARMASAARAALVVLRSQPDAGGAAPGGGDGPRLSAAARRRTTPGVAPSSCSRNTSARRSICIATCATRRSEAAFFEVYGNMLSLQMADQRDVDPQADALRCARVARGAAGARRNRPGRTA